jgi:hypothetical protein
VSNKERTDNHYTHKTLHLLERAMSDTNDENLVKQENTEEMTGKTQALEINSGEVTDEHTYLQ